MQDVMRFYGLEVNRAGFAVCPFHTDNDPSLKVYKGALDSYRTGALPSTETCRKNKKAVHNFVTQTV